MDGLRPETSGSARPAQDAAAAAKRCALCGARYERGVETCGGCPLHAGCAIECCPNCGYSSPKSSRLVDLWRRFRAGRS
jgi:hypothetical protein